MSSIFPKSGGLGVLRNSVKGVNAPTQSDTITTATNVIGGSDYTTSYSVSGGANIDAALTNDTWVDAIDKNFATPTVCEFSAVAGLHHSPAPSVGVSLSVRVYVDEVLQQERTVTNASSTSSITGIGTITITHPDSAFIASRVRVQFKRSGSMGTTASYLTASVIKHPSASV